MNEIEDSNRRTILAKEIGVPDSISFFIAIYIEPACINLNIF